MLKSNNIAAIGKKLSLALLMSAGLHAVATLAARADSLERMPVKEITVFKDGHALIIHEGEMKADKDGAVIIENLPRPVLGTFFPYSSSKGAPLQSVTTGRRKIDRAQTALTTAELVAANIGAAVHIDELIGEGEKARLVSYDAVIMGIPQRSAKEVADENGADESQTLPIKSALVQLKIDSGVSFVPIERIQTITFKSGAELKPKLTEQDLRNVLTLNFQNKSSGMVACGMMYVEKGIRWIPSYKVTIDGQGHAVVKLQATIVNDLIDLDNVDCNLTVGVPSFAFKGEADPISLSQSLAIVARNALPESRLRNNFSNSIMSQSASGSLEQYDQSSPEAPSEAKREGTKNEDLFVFNLKNITLKKGERMVVPVQQYNVDYKDLYCLDIAAAPPPEVSQQLAGRSDEKVAEQNKVMHKIRLFNSTRQPFTTAPALVMVAQKNDKSDGAARTEVLAQGMMTYASPGSNSDLTLTNAIDVKVKRDEREIERKADAVTWQDYKYARVNLAGSVSLTNYGNKPVAIEITRKVLGRLDTASTGGQMKMVNTVDELGLPGWWAHYSWPGWWAYMNGIGEFKWTRTIEAGKSIDVDYTWHYFWR